MSSEIFEQQLTVLPEHIDTQNHVNNVVYLQWAQDIAEAHWIKKSNDEFNQQYYWVVLSHFIQYKGPAFLKDLLSIKTHVLKNEGVRSVRVVEVFRTDKLLAKIKTEWALISREKNRPVRVPKEVNLMFFDEDELA